MQNISVIFPEKDVFEVFSKMATEQLKTGTILSDRYYVVKRIGGGGMGHVYLVQDVHLHNRERALKEMIGTADDEESRKKAIQDFGREAEVLAKLEHPSIPTIYDYFFSEGRYYLVMKYIPGGDLEQKLYESGGRATERQVTEWSIQVCDVLHYIHNQNPPVIYRDLKPANLMIDNSMQPQRIVLVDFGIARFVTPAQKSVTAVGTMGYAPPELFSGNVEPRSDIYSLGATMFHLLTGVDPQENPLLIFDFTKHPRPKQINPELTSEIDEIIVRAVDHTPSKRFSALEMKEALEKHLVHLNQHKIAVPVMGIGAKLAIIEPPGVQVLLSLTKERNLIGRLDAYSSIFPEIDLTPYEKETKVSRKHACIFKQGNEFFIEDLGSANGTYINSGPRIDIKQPYLLKDGDQIRVGEVLLGFKLS